MSTLVVPQILADVLEQLTPPKRSKYSWADAACVDQENPVQKGAQVALMGQIFQRAKLVRITVENMILKFLISFKA